MRFRRVAAAFDEVARARLCESSGSEHSSRSFTDLSDLVNSFIERDGVVQGKKGEPEGNESERESFWCDDDKRENLLGLFGCKESSGRRKICEEVGFACRNWDRSSQGFKRKLMTHLRDRGFDAGEYENLLAENINILFSFFFSFKCLIVDVVIKDFLSITSRYDFPIYFLLHPIYKNAQSERILKE